MTTDPIAGPARRPLRFSLRSAFWLQFVVAGISLFAMRYMWLALFAFVVFVAGVQAVRISGRKIACLWGGFGAAIVMGFLTIFVSGFSFVFGDVLALSIIIIGSLAAVLIGGYAGAQVILEADRFRANSSEPLVNGNPDRPDRPLGMDSGQAGLHNG